MAQLRWKIIYEKLIKGSDPKVRVEYILDILLSNRGIESLDDKEHYLTPNYSDIQKIPRVLHGDLKTIIERVQNAIKNSERIVIYGDYDVDGVTATGILWEALHKMGAVVFPYIPHRVEEGYGLNSEALSELAEQGTKLVITCDTGITADEEVTFAKSLGMDVIVTDHHSLPEKLPTDAVGIVHESTICGAAVAWKLMAAMGCEDGLELACMGTVADVMPLIGENRVIVIEGLKVLRKTERPGLLAMFKYAAIDPSNVGVYEIGHIIGPRLNAMGRLEHAMDSLRILLTKSKVRADSLARLLSDTNTERQQVTVRVYEEARVEVERLGDSKILIVGAEGWTQGVIGLVAGKLVDEFYRPSLVLSFDEVYAKGSARSVAGFNITEAIRTCGDILVHAGGHPMAAGFTIERQNFEQFRQRLNDFAEGELTEELLLRELKVDLEIPLSDVGWDLYHAVCKLEPFGMGNAAPTFLTRKMRVDDLRVVGAGGKHLKLKLSGMDAIAFGKGDMASDLNFGDLVDVVYTLDKNEWNGSLKLQLKVKDIRNTLE